MRSDVKKNDGALLKIQRFQELLAAVEKCRPELKKEGCRRRVFEFCKAAAKAATDAVRGSDPALFEELNRIGQRYKEGKCIEVEEGDGRGIPCPHPEAVGILDMPSTASSFVMLMCLGVWVMTKIVSSDRFCHPTAPAHALLRSGSRCRSSTASCR